MSKKTIDPKAPTKRADGKAEEGRTEEERTSQRLLQRKSSRIALRTTHRINL